VETVSDVSGMLVERVFLVSGVVKTVFPPNKKIREVFSFFTTNKKELRNRLFSLGELYKPCFMENTFYTEHILLRTHEIQDTIFGEHVPFSFFIRGRKFYACFTI
jgi:hypothetical protein